MNTLDFNKIEEITKAILSGKIFIYPTDTIYGLGCNAENKKAVEKIRKIKARDKNKPLSVIAPDIEWIKEHCIADNNFIKKYLPGKYTIILKKKKQNFLKWVSNTNSLGIRIPANKFTKIIQGSGVPSITTSVNLSGEKPDVNLKEISHEIKNKADMVIKSTEPLSGKPSILIIEGKERERSS